MENHTVHRHISDILLGNRLMQRFGQRFPRVFEWLGKRLSHHTFFGLPFTTIVLVFIANGILLAKVTENVINSETLVVIDKAISKFIEPFQTQSVISFFLAYTQLGSPYIAIPFVLVLCLVFFLLHKRPYAVALLISTGGAGVSSLISKTVFHRARPDLKVYYMPHSFSFTSGHATAAVAVYAMLLYLFWIDGKSHYKNIIVGAGSVLVILLGLSRIILGVHFLSDVLGGFLMGTLWLLLGVSAMEYFKTKIAKK